MRHNLDLSDVLSHPGKKQKKKKKKTIKWCPKFHLNESDKLLSLTAFSKLNFFSFQHLSLLTGILGGKHLVPVL